MAIILCLPDTDWSNNRLLFFKEDKSVWTLYDAVAAAAAAFYHLKSKIK